jgi:nitrite reductase (NADH) small subunit
MSEWLKVCRLEEIPALGARVVQTGRGDIAVFRSASDEVFALNDKCPHKGGPLAQGIVAGRRVTCPLHGQNFDLETGEAVAPDTGCTHRYAVKVEDGVVHLQL